MEGFGVAILKCYGWKEGQGNGKNAKEDVQVVQYVRKGNKEGLGFQMDKPTFDKKGREQKQLVAPKWENGKTRHVIGIDEKLVVREFVFHFLVVDPHKASYGVENPIFAIIQLAQTTMRIELGKITLDKTFEALNEKIVNIKEEEEEERVGYNPVENVLLKKFKEDLKNLPDDRGMDEFEDVPMEGFGVAILKGYGWKEGQGIGKNAKEDVQVVQYVRRGNKEGLGFQPDKPISCSPYRSWDINPPHGVRAAMEMQAEAERRKRAQVLESEGERQANINIADGKKNSVILASEAAMMDQVNRAKGEADAILARAQATAKGIYLLSEAIKTNGGVEAASLRIAEQYIHAFGQIAQKGTTMLLPSTAANPASMMAQAMSIYKTMIGGSGDGAGESTHSGLLDTKRRDGSSETKEGDSKSAAKSNNIIGEPVFSLQNNKK
ncbi:hypothetical protein IFM89_011592 [Coptis chinensis]|uniref:G-patch domain-containing protein n=1 Tax=Coptis chinensis TaxID=261450 RepID=A0A835H4I0_9MAGN|nr:hypothetical protein IFM89_011592 [Coptis chinensis]